MYILQCTKNDELWEWCNCASTNIYFGLGDKLKHCLDCNCDISDKGNRAIRCNDCQEKHRNNYEKENHKKRNEKSNKEHGSTRYNKTTYQWTKFVKTLSQQEIHDLVSCYRNQLRQATGREKLDIKTRIKILCDLYEPNELKETINEVDHEYAMLPHSEHINWQKAEHGWTKYYDEGLVTLNPDVFFGKKKVNK